ncbi:metallophosphoesterase family protein [Enterococcus sp. AZ072]|uniref:metallophosphoesterase family protein n=1 Tax=unclassified Enterococcus TaxID=2608891 RepID=UPI003D2DD565
MRLMRSEKNSSSFRILQFTDLHLRTWPLDEADQQTLQMIQAMSKKEQPDLILFTGDIVWSTIADAPLAIFQEFIDFCNTLEFPIALTYGNHDSNHPAITRGMLRQKEMDIKSLAEKKCSLIANDRESYVLEIYNSNQLQIEHLLFIIDSGEYTDSPYSRYDWILPEQIDWFKTTARYYHKHSAVKSAYSFLHIPLQEFMEAYQVNRPINSVVDELRVDSPEINTGFFAALLFDPITKGVFAGHNHDNNFQTNYLGLEVVFGQVSGYGAISQNRRGARLIVLEEQQLQTSILYGENYF